MIRKDVWCLSSVKLKIGNIINLSNKSKHEKDFLVIVVVKRRKCRYRLNTGHIHYNCDIFVSDYIKIEDLASVYYIRKNDIKNRRQ